MGPLIAGVAAHTPLGTVIPPRDPAAINVPVAPVSLRNSLRFKPFFFITSSFQPGLVAPLERAPRLPCSSPPFPLIRASRSPPSRSSEIHRKPDRIEHEAGI